MAGPGRPLLRATRAHNASNARFTSASRLPAMGQEPFDADAGDEGPLLGVAGETRPPVDETAIYELSPTTVGSPSVNVEAESRIIARDGLTLLLDEGEAA